MTQKEIILKHMQEKGSISTLECFQEYFITDLQHSIMVLRKEGYNILDKWEISPNKKKYKRYWIDEGNN